MISRKFIILTAICIITFAAIIFLFSPFFHIQEIVIIGNNTVSENEIRERLDIDDSTNILFLNTGSARRRVMENLYIGSVNFSRGLPSRLYVEVRERRLAAYIEHTPGNYLYIDEFGRVLEIRPFMMQPLPLIVGLNFTHFALGEVLDVPNAAAFSIVTQYAQLLYRHGLVCRVTHINVADIENTRILVGYVEFNVGGLSDADEKVRSIIGILDALPYANVRGFVDMREIRAEYFFQLLI